MHQNHVEMKQYNEMLLTKSYGSCDITNKFPKRNMRGLILINHMKSQKGKDFHE